MEVFDTNYLIHITQPVPTDIRACSGGFRSRKLYILRASIPSRTPLAGSESSGSGLALGGLVHGGKKEDVPSAQVVLEAQWQVSSEGGTKTFQGC